jgi:hypothetical protein
MVDTALVPLAQAAEWFPKRRGRKLSVKAIRRRIHTGERGIRLQATRDGGEWFTCRAWVAEFHAAVTAQSLAPQGCPRTPSQRARGIARAKEQLRRFGIYAAT